MPGRRRSILITCEHASNRVPKKYHIPAGLLNTHKAYDKHASYAARRLAKILGVETFEGQYTRLVVDLNRKKAVSRYFPTDRWMEDHHREWRKKAMDYSPGLHISVHSFAPILKGVKRDADIGLLYDPSRDGEKCLCKRLKKMLPGYKVRMNYPFRGIADGLTTAMRKSMGNDYIGIELELNQRLSLKIIDDIIDRIASVIGDGLYNSEDKIGCQYPDSLRSKAP